MKKIKIKIPFKTIFSVMGVIFGATITISTLLMAYIMFVPDNFPKPFYLSYAAAPTIDPRLPVLAPKATPTPAHIYPTSADEIKPGNGIMFDTGSQIINLTDPTGRKYLRVDVILEFAPKDLGYYKMAVDAQKTYETTFTTDLKTRLPLINDSIITMLSARTFEQVYTADGKEQLRKALTQQINLRIPEYKVIYLYFTEFVVQ